MLGPAIFDILIGIFVIVCFFSILCRMCKEELPLDDDDEESCFCWFIFKYNEI